MLRSLWSGVAGLRTHQLEMDVIGNNIANVNTTAYKSQATGFQDILYQTVKEGSAGGENKGSTNVAQVGLGSKVGSIYTNIAAQGSAVTTNNVLDLMISGDAFFVVEQGGVNTFTRDGAFTIDAEGYLVTQNNGYYVKGVDGGDMGNAAPDRLQVIKRAPVDVNGDGVIEANENQDTMPGAATGAAYIKGNIDSYDPSLEEGKTFSLEVYGNDGNPYTLKFNLTDAGDTEDNTFTLTLTTVLNQDGSVAQYDVNQSIDLVYDKHNGELISDNIFNVNTDVISLPIELTHTTNYAGTQGGHSSTIYAYKGNEQGLEKGYGLGVLNGISFGTDGSIYGSYSNGQTIKKGHIASAVFNNAMGLEKIGDNLYAESLNSGAATYQDITVDGGYMQSGVLEGSNVDLAKEFTDMITTQRGFQANSRVITTSDEMLQILKGLKR